MRTAGSTQLDLEFVDYIRGYFLFLKKKPGIDIPIRVVEAVQLAPGILAILDNYREVDIYVDPIRWETLPPYDVERITVQYAREYGIDVLMASGVYPPTTNFKMAASHAHRYLSPLTDVLKWDDPPSQVDISLLQ